MMPRCSDFDWSIVSENQDSLIDRLEPATENVDCLNVIPSALQFSVHAEFGDVTDCAAMLSEDIVSSSSTYSKRDTNDVDDDSDVVVLDDTTGNPLTRLEKLPSTPSTYDFRRIVCGKAKANFSEKWKLMLWMFFVAVTAVSVGYGVERLCTTSLEFYLNRDSIAETLGNIESLILTCIGLQTIEAERKGDLVQVQVCTDPDGKFTSFIRDELLDSHTAGFLFAAQKKLHKGELVTPLEWTVGPSKGKAIDIPLIIRQLEYKNVFGRLVFNDTEKNLNEVRVRQVVKAACTEAIEAKGFSNFMWHAREMVHGFFLPASLANRTQQKLDE